MLGGSSAMLRHLPPGVGQFRVADRLYAGIAAAYPRDTLVRVRLRDGALVDLDLNDYVEARVALVRHWQPAVVAELARRLRGGGVLFDVGAHVGIVALGVASATREGSPRVHAFEALPHNAARLRRNAGLNPDLRVTVEHVAVGAEPGELRIAAPDPRVPSMGYVVGRDDPRPAVTVPVRTVDDYAAEHGIERVDAMKVDVEGYEAAVIAGARGLLAEQRIGAIVCELNPDELALRGSSPAAIVDTLAAHGYRRHVLPLAGLARWTRPKGSFDDALFLPAG
jgi:FkbM family methyltransferase